MEPTSDRADPGLPTFVSLTGAIAALAAGNPPAGRPPYASTQPAVRFEYWQQRLLDITAALADREALRAARVVFLGDSITDFWSLADSPWFPGQAYGLRVWEESFGAGSPDRALNFGISGDRTEHVLHRILPRNAGGQGGFDPPELDPDVIVLMIGINNSWGGEPPMADSVEAGIRAVLETLHVLRPRATIVLQSLLPTNEPAKNASVVVPVNARLRALAAAPSHSGWVRYLDLHSGFVDPSGALVDALFVDGVHPNEAGYRVWRDRLVPLLAELRATAGRP